MLTRQSTEGEVSRPGQVEGTLEYLARGSTLNRRYVAPGAEREQTGADKAIAFRWTLRHVSSTGVGVQPPAADVHVDNASDRAEGLARATLRQAGTPDFRFRRFVAINLWRALSAPPQDWPLALCDGRSVDPAEGVRNAMIRVDSLAERNAIPLELPDDPARPEAFVFHFNPRHRWYYFPDMTRDELLLFKLYDSSRTGACRMHPSLIRPSRKPRRAKASRSDPWLTFPEVSRASRR
jgi:hypothetical protein